MTRPFREIGFASAFANSVITARDAEKVPKGFEFGTRGWRIGRSRFPAMATIMLATIITDGAISCPLAVFAKTIPNESPQVPA
jgi:hypothetical protein